MRERSLSPRVHPILTRARIKKLTTFIYVILRARARCIMTFRFPGFWDFAMRVCEDMTFGMRYLLMAWSRFGAQCWVSFQTSPQKLPALDEKWRTAYYTHLAPERRYYHRRKGWPVAWAVAFPVLHDPGRVTVFLVATPSVDKYKGDHSSPWGRERWRRDPYVISDLYRLYQQQNAAHQLVWTWGFQDRQLGLMRNYLKGKVLEGAGGEIADTTQRWVRLHPMFSGVRSQMRRLLREAQKHWQARWKTEWPGADPEALPSIGRFRNDKDKAPEP